MPKSKAPSQTFEEPAYLKKLVQEHIPVGIKLVNGEEVEGFVEYWDADFLRLTREGDTNLFIYKHDMKYIYEIPLEND